jgi:adenine-specific DNA methylase
MATKKEFIAQEVAKAVGAGKAVALETVDFSDPNRPKTCLEVDFPILPVNQVAIIEGNAGKPIYQMSKWWARRRSSVFRSMLIAAATKAPDDPSHAAKLVWDNYYANHQKKGAFKHLKVADIFMGGGTTLVEGSRLGMQMSGNDLNPVAWFVVKQELADVDLDEVKALLADIEAEVKPQIMPYYYCDGPNGEKGIWTHKPSGKVMDDNFDPLSLTPDERKNYDYDGPEIIYTFWSKHGPCQVTGCGHRTPIMTSPVMAIKSISVKHWKHSCKSCGTAFDVEEAEARMAPDVPLYVAPSEKRYSILSPKGHCICPSCGHVEIAKLGKGKNKKVNLTLLVHPEWLAGSPKAAPDGSPFGGSAQDTVETTSAWDAERASKLRLLEVRGALPDSVTCPETNVTFETGKNGGTVPKRSNYACGSCGTVQDVLTTIKASKKTGPMAGYSVQAFSPARKEDKAPYGGRYFIPFDDRLAAQYDAALAEWDRRKAADLSDYWPKSELPYGFMTHHLNGGVPNHGFTHWHTMFNPRQLLSVSLILKSIFGTGNYSDTAREYVMGAFQQFIRNQNMFCFWDIGYDKLVPHLSNNNFHPKSNVIENCVFSDLGRGNWKSCIQMIEKGTDWAKDPWELVSVETLKRTHSDIASEVMGKSEKVYPGDALGGADVLQASSTDLEHYADGSLDLVITDPPFGGLLHYSELSDFFYVWMRLPLKDKYPNVFGSEYTPKSMEAVANKAREPEDADGFYQRLLTACWACLTSAPMAQN